MPRNCVTLALLKGIIPNIFNTGCYMATQRDKYKTSRGLFIALAAFEYFIAILAGTTYLAKLGTAIGLDDGTIGLITSFLALGCGFQIVSIFIGERMRRKNTIIMVVLFDQLCFVALYLVPFIRLPDGVRTWLFIGLLLAGNILLNIAAPNKIAWSRGLVAQGQLGKFSALNEIVSLVSGMLFSFAMGALIDAFEAKNQLMLAFGIICAVIFILMEICIICLLLAKEKPMPKVEEERPLVRIKSAFTDRTTLILMPVYILWNIAVYTTTPFFGTYAIGELGFSMTAVSLISAGYAILRSLVSRPLGAYGDRTNFVNNLTIGISSFAAALLSLTIGGQISYIIYNVFYSITMASTNAALIILVFDHVPAEKRSNSLAVLYSLSGICGFLATLAVRPLVNHIQAQGNKFLFIEGVYAQQVVSVIGIIFAVLAILYANIVIRRLPGRPRLVADGNVAENKAESK